MDVATALTVAQTLFATLQCAEVRQLCSICNYESELQKLLDTVKTINNFLLDADSKCQELTNEGKYWVQNLKDAVYDADDLMDEFNTIVHQLKRMPGGKVLKKVRRFFSSNNQLMFAVNMSREIKKLREKLNSLAKNHSDFGFSELYKPVKSREETCSYVYEQSIIGRDADKEAIVKLLLKNDSEKNISFVTIVGIGGLGKTALAQLVFNDLRIREAFKKMYWVCVSESFSMKDILGKMHKGEERNLEDLCVEGRKQIEGKRYLLVLDDVWCENYGKWDELINFLILGGRGSRILVTSRSKKVARSIGNYPIHELQGLSKKDSWELFKKISLGQTEDEAVTGLVEIGKAIVRKCADVPLSIRVVASLLRGQDITVWQSYKRIDLSEMCDGEEGIMPTLIFSYYHLAPELKCCFSFCSLFPEDHVIEKEVLISLWMAQGYLVPRGKHESMVDVGEKYISILLHRCFFQDIRRDGFGEVNSFKMHDLIHDLARKVAGTEYLTLTACTNDFERKVLHLSIDSDKGLAKWLDSNNNKCKTLRTCFKNCYIQSRNLDAIISKCSRVRVLALQGCLTTKNLQDIVGKLLHLRYLDLSHNSKLEMLPKTITKLHNLQTLKLSYCNNLKELPEDTSELVNLRVLNIDRCYRLTHMPAGMGKLTRLQSLPLFIMHVDDELKQEKKGKPIDLKALINNLRGDLYVRHYPRPNNACTVVRLKSLKLRCELESCHNSHKDSQEILLEILFFNHQFHELNMEKYGGTKLPSLASGLVSIHLTRCDELQYLSSSLSQLCHLKRLSLENMESIEYIESDVPSPSAKFFPSLEKLVLFELPKLKGWWRDITRLEKEAAFHLSFPPLHDLTISSCKRLTYFPSCPHVAHLCIYNVNEALTFCVKEGGAQSNPFSYEKLMINNSCVFNSLFREFVGTVVCIELNDIENLGTIREGLQFCASSLRELKIINGCWGVENLGIEHLTNLKSLSLSVNIEKIPWKSLYSLSSLEITNSKAVKLPTDIQYLTSLQSLFLFNCRYLEDLGECINSLTSLQHLQLQYCDQLKSLPKEMCYLASFTTLEIKDCHQLESLPEAMRHLTSLGTLEIKDCPELKSLPEAMRHLTSLSTLKIINPNPELKDRCRKPNGEDWPKIRHIHRINISSY